MQVPSLCIASKYTATCHIPTSQDIAPFDSPKVELEQYPTGPHLASRLLFTVSVTMCTIWLHMVTPVPQVANSFDEFEGQTVLDLGCGTVQTIAVVLWAL